MPPSTVRPAPAPPLDVGVLLAGCKRGDERALATLIQTYQQRIYRLALRVCADPALAEEAAVEAFYKIWTRSRRWRGPTGGETWIYRIAVRTVLDLRRGRKRWWQRLRKASVWDDEDPAPGPEEAAEAREEQQVSAERLTQAIETLKPADRLLIHLYYDEEHSLAEIGQILETPAENVKMRLSRARKRLREALEADHVP